VEEVLGIDSSYFKWDYPELSKPTDFDAECLCVCASCVCAALRGKYISPVGENQPKMGHRAIANK
jgi:hypothetical protein